MTEENHERRVKGIRTIVKPKRVEEFVLFGQEENKVAIDVFEIAAVAKANGYVQIYLKGNSSPFLVVDKYDDLLFELDNCHALLCDSLEEH